MFRLMEDLPDRCEAMNCEHKASLWFVADSGECLAICGCHAINSKDVIEELIRTARIRMAAIEAYPDHHPETALINYQAGREVWDSNGDMW